MPATVLAVITIHFISLSDLYHQTFFNSWIRTTAKFRSMEAWVNLFADRTLVCLRSQTKECYLSATSRGEIGHFVNDNSDWSYHELASVALNCDDPNSGMFKCHNSKCVNKTDVSRQCIRNTHWGVFQPNFSLVSQGLQREKWLWWSLRRRQLQSRANRLWNTSSWRERQIYRLCSSKRYSTSISIVYVDSNHGFLILGSFSSPRQMGCCLWRRVWLGGGKRRLPRSRFFGGSGGKGGAIFPA